MFNRSTKMTALLVAAASVMSTVPAFAADSAELKTKNGTIQNAVAYKDGKYAFQGYKDEDSEDGLYYNSGEKDAKDKLQDDADTLVEKFGDKFAKVTENDDDEYVLDLSTGKVSGDDTLEELDNEAESRLETKLGKADKYEDADITSFSRLDQNQFADMWYSFETSNNGFGFTDEKGAYVDCSYDLNAYVFYDKTTKDGTEGKMFKIEDMEDDREVANVEGVKTKVSANTVSLVKALGQDDKYLYALIKVNVKTQTEDQEPTYADHFYVQKVSKAQGEKKDEAYRPKSTECYEVGYLMGGIFDEEKNELKIANENLKDILKNDDVKDAFESLTTHKDAVIRVVDGVIYVTYTSEDDKVKTDKLVLRQNEKIDQKYAVTRDNEVKYEKIGKVSSHVALKDDDKDTDAYDWSVDVNGNVWAIYKGEIKKSEKLGDFKTLYTCDRTMNKLDVYDESSLVAWEDDGDVYTTVTEGKKVDPTPVPDPTPAVTEGWNQDATTGAWSYVENGAKVTGWKQIAGTWFLMDGQGNMLTGWQQVGGVWYYLNEAHDGTFGAMVTGWRYDTNYGGYFYFDGSGAMQTGWYQDYTGTWYYSYSNGLMAANTVIDGYTLDASGAWV